jgi:hypothetical protein
VPINVAGSVTAVRAFTTNSATLPGSAALSVTRMPSSTAVTIATMMIRTVPAIAAAPATVPIAAPPTTSPATLTVVKMAAITALLARTAVRDAPRTRAAAAPVAA